MPAAARVVVAATAAVCALAQPGAQAPDLFSFHSNEWLNLHHFIRAHARGRPITAELTDDERRVWMAGVAFYAAYAKRDVLRDEGMVAIKNALRRTEGKPTLDGAAIDGELRGTLEKVMPIYRKHWWPAHDRGNREWIAGVRPLVDRHGAAIGRHVARAYDVSWPGEPIPVDLSVSAGPVGAYTTDNPTHVMISSADEGYRGYRGLEMLFHESSHGWRVLFNGVARAARDQGVTVPPQLWHGVLFFTAGEVTQRELATNGIEYTEYADAGLYTNLCGAGCREKIAEHWTPRLDGKVSVDEALAALVRAFR